MQWPIQLQVIGWTLEVLLIIGNGLVILLFASRSRLRTTTNFFVLSLAAADFGTAIFFPILILPKGCAVDQPCDAYIPVFLAHAAGNTFIYASGTCLCALAFDRFLAVVKPFRYVTFMTKKRVVCINVAAWCIPVAIVFIPLLTLEFTNYSDATNEQIKRYLWIGLCAYDIALMVVLVSTVGRILFVVRRHARKDAAIARQLKFNHSTGARNSRTPESAASKLIATLVVVFVACQIVHVCDVLGYLGFLRRLDAVTWTTIVLPLFNSVANPFVYAFFKKEIRAELRQLLRCQRSLPAMDVECVNFRPNMNVACLSERDQHQEQRILEAAV